MEQSLPKHDCSKFVEQVFLVLDGEMSEEETNLFIQDIERCSHCLQHYNIEKELLFFWPTGRKENVAQKPCGSASCSRSVI